MKNLKEDLGLKFYYQIIIIHGNECLISSFIQCIIYATFLSCIFLSTLVLHPPFPVEIHFYFHMVRVCVHACKGKKQREKALAFLFNI